MSNRADRRKEMKTLPRWKRTTTPEQRRAALLKNGISQRDLATSYNEGYNVGFEDAKQFTYRCMCAAIGLALNDLHGFGRSRVVRVLNRAAWHMFNTFTEREIMDQVYERIGFRYEDDPITGHLVEEVEK